MPEEIKNGNTRYLTNWFYIILVFLAGLGSASLISFVFLAFNLDQEELAMSVYSNHRPVSLALITAKKEYSLNDLIEVSILLNTGKRKTAGVDIVLKYDPQFLELQSQNSNAAQVKSVKKERNVNPKEFLSTEFSSFDIFPYMKLDSLNGNFFFSALAKPLREVNGQGAVAVLNFKAVKQGETAIKLVFEKGSARDSNVAYLGKDVLAKVYDLQLKIQ
ncbi:MAG: cohesin domain-containing protein [Patescibacteria group bacterium]